MAQLIKQENNSKSFCIALPSKAPQFLILRNGLLSAVAEELIIQNYKMLQMNNEKWELQLIWDIINKYNKTGPIATKVKLTQATGNDVLWSWLI